MKCSKKNAQSGFSLVEVALSVAIAALAIITLLGLLPQGLDMSRKTGMLAFNSNIFDHIIRDIENTKWSAMPVGKNKKYFNEQGVEVPSDSKQIVFVAEVDLQQQAPLPQTEALQNYLNRVVVRIANTGNVNFTFGKNNKASYATFCYLVAKTR